MSMLTPGLLANAIADAVGARTRLLLKRSTFDIFADYESTKTITQKSSSLTTSLNEHFDFIAGDFPLGQRRDASMRDALPEIRRLRKNWAEIYSAAGYLNNSGMAIFLVESAFWSSEWTDFIELLSSQGIYFVASFRFPKQTLPNTLLVPCFAVFSRRRQQTLFVADVSSRSSLVELVEAFLNQRSGKALLDGIIMPASEFRGFPQLVVEREIEALETQYKTYRHSRMVPDLAEINDVVACKNGESYKERPNAVYIPRLNTSPVVFQLRDTTLKHHNYIQVVLKPTVIVNEYLAVYFTSHLGRLSLQALQQGLIIPRLSKVSLQNLLIPLPDVAQQKIIVGAHQAIVQLEHTLADFRMQLSLRPVSATTITDSVTTMLNQVNLLSESDKVLVLIRNGESRTIEFKETLVLDIKKGTKERYIEDAVLKTISAFLNSQGGTLLIGVTDSHEPIGIARELDQFFQGNRDNLLKHLKNIIKRSIGEAFYPYLEYNTVIVGESLIIRVDCTAADAPCFLNTTEFYVRTNPATDKLDGQKMLDYVQRHFHK